MIAHKFLMGMQPRNEREHKIAVAALHAQKFDFGEIPCEGFMQTEHGPVAKVPIISNTEREAWCQGLVPLPYFCCFFEFTLVGAHSAIIVWENTHKGISTWVSTRLNYVEGFPTQIDDCTAFISVEDHGPNQFMGSMWPNEVPDKAKHFAMAGVDMAIYLAVMVLSKTTEVVHVPAPIKLNKRRVKKGKLPISEHRLVRIVPVRYVDTSPGAGGTHASPRLHWRRSHIRTLNRGTDKEQKVLIARMLVGRKELGEITHDYVVQGGHQ